MSNPYKTVHRAMHTLVRAIDQIGFEAAREAVMFWEDIVFVESQDRPWLANLASGVQHALAVAEDARDQANTCTIRIAWSAEDRHMQFRFPVGDAGEVLGAVILNAVQKAIADEVRDDA